MGNDSLNGGTDNDTLSSGAGDDTINAEVGNLVDSGTGTDYLNLNLSTQTTNLTFNNLTSGFNLPGIISVSNFENFNITTGSGNDFLNQSGLVNGVVYRANDTLNGGAGNDTLSGGLGHDRYDGGTGNDLLILDYSIGDTEQGIYVLLGSRVAHRRTSTGGNLDSQSFSNIEQFNITGTIQNDSLYGSSGDDTFAGGDGNDTLSGGTGNDTLSGGAGDDTYVIDSISDIITENANEGTDIVQSSITYTLGVNLEKLTLTGSSAINGTGNSLNNTITGNSGNNILSGDAGNDSLTGGNGNDTLIGGLGNEILTGSSGADRFLFNTPNQGIDTIKDFLSSQGDKIAVSASGFGGGLIAGSSITAAQFVLGSTATDSSDRIIYNISSGALYFDGDGTGSLTAVQLATLSTKPTLAYTDIMVIT